MRCFLLLSFTVFRMKKGMKSFVSSNRIIDWKANTFEFFLYSNYLIIFIRKCSSLVACVQCNDARVKLEESMEVSHHSHVTMWHEATSCLSQHSEWHVWYFIVTVSKNNKLSPSPAATSWTLNILSVITRTCFDLIRPLYSGQKSIQKLQNYNHITKSNISAR
jgi:hypothetical protein